MYARAVDAAGARLRTLRQDEWQNLALAGVALALAMGATEFAPQLAGPLLVGGLAAGLLGIRALWRHWDLVDRLAGERDAYTIAEVLAYASRYATLDRRRTYAAIIRSHLQPSDVGPPPRADAAAVELSALAEELENGDLGLDPVCAVACQRLTSELTECQVLNLNSAMSRETLRSSAHRIRSGFSTTPALTTDA